MNFAGKTLKKGATWMVETQLEKNVFEIELRYT
jgi:hypothetical protein